MKKLEKQLAKIELCLEEYKAEDINKLLDLTLLQENATETAVKEIYKQATNSNMAAICLFPQDYRYLPNKINIKKATVVNFPSGKDNLNQVIAEIDEAINAFEIDEIDYVFPYYEYLNNSKTKALQHCEECFNVCLKYNKTLKVILETGALPSLECIYNLSKELINIGCNFLKTSTGKTNKGASVEAVFAILSAIKDSKSNCGIKISGGVRSYQSAAEYIKLCEHVLNKEANASWLRIGTSGLN